MQRTEPSLFVVAICLAALAGFVDALAYTSLGGFFASFMSGNSTRLGVALADGISNDAMVAGSLILSFVSGVILASIVWRVRRGNPRSSVMALVTLLIALGALVGTLAPGSVALLLLAMAMGAENGVVSHDGEVTFGVTYMTGTLVRMGQKLAGALMGDTDRWLWLRYLALWLGFVAGVVLGVGAHEAWNWNALWFAALASAALTVLTARMGPVPAAADSP